MNRAILSQFKKVNEAGYKVILSDDIKQWYILLDIELQQHLIQMIIPDNYPINPPDFYFMNSNTKYKANEKVCLGDNKCIGIIEYIILLISKYIIEPATQEIIIINNDYILNKFIQYK